MNIKYCEDLNMFSMGLKLVLDERKRDERKRDERKRDEKKYIMVDRGVKVDKNSKLRNNEMYKLMEQIAFEL